MVGHYTERAPGLDPLDHLRQAGRDAHTPDQKCLLNARRWQATRLLLRPLWFLQQKHKRSQSSDLAIQPLCQLSYFDHRSIDWLQRSTESMITLRLSLGGRPPYITGKSTKALCDPPYDLRQRQTM
jgi:hypothetical protein